MALINYSQIVDGTTGTASQINTPLTTIYNEFNGNITAANLANNAVTTPKIADGAVTADKRSGGFVVINHSFTSGTGTETVTGFGFKPKAVWIFSRRTSNTATVVSNGMAYDTGASIVQSAQSAANNTTDARTISSTTESFLSGSTTGDHAFRGAITSFDSDGITVNVTLNGSIANARDFSIMGLA
jgi:hypothetical protein